ncbi:MAG: Plug domain-containing protein, partial [Bacteroidota bacterium]
MDFTTMVLNIKKIGFISSSYTINTKQLNEINIYLEADLNHLNEIVVYGNQSSLKSETANNIEVLESKTMREQGAMNLSDGIAKLPGVNQLSTGAGISKPVIRGLFGNRIQTVLLGMRFDNQQWQDE